MTADFESKIQNPKSKNCLVTGATGVVGVPLVRELVAQGHRVKVLARGGVAADLLPANVEIVRGDLNDVSALIKASAGANWIFHLAAKLHINNPGTDLRREYEEVNVQGTARLIEAASKQNVEKFVFFSTINVYGASDGSKIFDESDKIAPNGFYAESKAAAEKLVLAEKCGIVLRLAAVYGSRMKGNYVRLLKALRRGHFFFVGKNSNRRTLIHQQDAARAAILAAEEAIGNSIYNVSDGNVYAFSEIIAVMSEVLGKNTPKLRLPLMPIGLGVGLAEDLGKLFKIKSSINRALLEKLLEDSAVSGAKIKRELGFHPQFDLTAGWRETLAKSQIA
ncbi:MAG: NAD-dependent epimerase/dehydratase family protein [Pyrinomonadaceae bacterium]